MTSGPDHGAPPTLRISQIIWGGLMFAPIMTA